MRTLVTGGAGFIGSHLVDALLARGDDVRVVDNLSTGGRRNLAHVVGDIDFVEGDLRSYERAAAVTDGCDLVFHQAALPSVPRSIIDPLTTSAVNVTGTLNVLLASRDAGIGRVVFASSSSVYGSSEAELKSEEQPVAPMSPYAVSKYAGEANCRAFSQVYGLETVAIRYFNVFGPRQSPVGGYAAAIPRFAACALRDERPTIHGDGLQSRDFTAIENVVHANLLASTAPDVAGEVFNIAVGETRTLLDLLAELSAVSGIQLPPLHTAARAGDVRMSRANISKARRALGYEPVVGFTEGLARTFEHMSEDSAVLSQIDEAALWAQP